MDALPEITDVRRLTLRPGDTLVLRLAREPSMADVDRIRHIVQAALDTDAPVLVLGPGEDIEVIEQTGDGT